MGKGKLIEKINIILPLIMFVVAFKFLNDKTPLYFLVTIWIIFSLIPIIISKLSKWRMKRKDIFSYKYSNPLITGIIITSVFFIFSQNQDNKWVIIVTLIIFIIIYSVNHIYISKKYPHYYFKD